MDKYFEISQKLLKYQSLFKKVESAYATDKMTLKNYNLFLTKLQAKLKRLIKSNKEYIKKDRTLLNKFRLFTLELKYSTQIAHANLQF